VADTERGRSSSVAHGLCDAEQARVGAQSEAADQLQPRPLADLRRQLGAPLAHTVHGPRAEEQRTVPYTQLAPLGTSI
jgi:hypothetical protein